MFTMRLSEAEAAHLEALARHFGVSSATLVRSWIGDNYRAAVAPPGEPVDLLGGKGRNIYLETLKAIRKTPWVALKNGTGVRTRLSLIGSPSSGRPTQDRRPASTCRSRPS